MKKRKLYWDTTLDPCEYPQNIKEIFFRENIKNRSKVIIEEEPMDVEPLEKSSNKKPQNSLSNDNEILDIEDPW